MPLAPLRFSVYLPAVRSLIGMRPRGGVVTQRTANPCTPVRFRARPPFPNPLCFIALFRSAIAPGPFSVAPFHPDDKRSAPAAHGRQILRQHQQTERQHPEPQYRKKTKCAAGNQACSECDSHGCALRQPEKLRSDMDLAPACMEIEKTVSGHRAGSAFGGYAGLSKPVVICPTDGL